MDKKKRRSLTIRLQPSDGTPLAEIVDWLNAMPTSEKERRVGELLSMTCLPLVRADAGATPEEVERCYWEMEQWLGHYKFTLRQMLKIKSLRPSERIVGKRIVGSLNSRFDGLR